MTDERPPKRALFPRGSWARHTGIGIEYAAVVGGFALVGYWIDRHYESGPWGVLIGAALGLVGGTYNLVRQSLAAFGRSHKEPKAASKEEEGRGKRG